MTKVAIKKWGAITVVSLASPVAALLAMMPHRVCTPSELAQNQESIALWEKDLTAAKTDKAPMPVKIGPLADCLDQPITAAQLLGNRVAMTAWFVSSAFVFSLVAFFLWPLGAMVLPLARRFTTEKITANPRNGASGEPSP